MFKILPQVPNSQLKELGGHTFLLVKECVPQISSLSLCVAQNCKTSADKIPILSNTELGHLFYDNNPDISPQAFKKRLHEARKKTKEMESDGHIVVEQNVRDPKTGKEGWRILEPRKNNITERGITEKGA